MKPFGIIRQINNAWGCHIQIADTFKYWRNEDGQEHEVRVVGGKVFFRFIQGRVSFITGLEIHSIPGVNSSHISSDLGLSPAPTEV